MLIITRRGAFSVVLHIHAPLLKFKLLQPCWNGTKRLWLDNARDRFNSDHGKHLNFFSLHLRSSSSEKVGLPAVSFGWTTDDKFYLKSFTSKKIFTIYSSSTKNTYVAGVRRVRQLRVHGHKSRSYLTVASGVPNENKKDGSS